MAGLEPARANYSPTDFKSVASTIPPHRRCGVHSKLFLRPAKMDSALRTDSDAASKIACLRFGTLNTVNWCDREGPVVRTNSSARCIRKPPSLPGSRLTCDLTCCLESTAAAQAVFLRSFLRFTCCGP